MANRYPLIIDTTDGNKIKELPAGDNLNLRNNNIIDVQNINALGAIDAAVVRVGGEALSPKQFTDLTDVPNTYNDQANKFLKVKPDESGVEFVPLSDLGTISVNNISVKAGGNIEPETDLIANLGRSNKRFFAIYAKSFVGTFVGTLRGNNGSTLVDGTNNRIPYAAIFGAPTSLSEFTNDTGFLNSTGVESAINAALSEFVPSGDFVGSVYSNDSTLLVDGANKIIKLDGTVNSNITPVQNGTHDLGTNSNRFKDLYLSGNIVAEGLEFDGVGLVTVESGSDLVLNAANGAGKIVASNSRIVSVADPINPQDVATKSYVDNLIFGIGSPLIRDIVGSVFADDSTILVDGVSGTIPGYISVNELKTLVADSVDFSDFQTKIALL